MMSAVATNVLQDSEGLDINDIKSYARIPEVHPLPNLIETQIKAYRWFKEEGLTELFE